MRYKHELPNYGVFDEKRVFAAGPLPTSSTSAACASACRSARTSGSPTWSDASGEARRRDPDRAERLAVRARQGGPAHRARRRARATRPACRCVYVNQVGGQDELVFDGGSFVVNADRRLVVLGCRSGARRPARHPRRLSGVWSAQPRPGRTAARRARQHLSGADGRPARLREQEPFPRRAARAVRRHRLGADGGGRGRRARRRTGCAAFGCRRASPATRARTMPTESRAAARHAARDDRDRRRRRRGRADARAAVRRSAARHHRREHAGARPRAAADGGVEQVRLDAADDREQVGDVGRLRDALRRHVRRLLRAEGPLQDRGLRAVRVAQCAPCPTARSAPGRGHPGASSPRRRPRSCARPEGSGLAAAVRRARRDAERPGREERSVDEIAGGGHTPATRCARPAAARSRRNTSAARRRPA